MFPEALENVVGEIWGYRAVKATKSIRTRRRSGRKEGGRSLIDLFDVLEEHVAIAALVERAKPANRSEEHTSELQSLMRISYAVFCLHKQTKDHQTNKQR